MTVGIALLGAGIFAKSAYVPALAALPPGAGVLKAVYSRSEASARGLLSVVQEKLSLANADAPTIYHDGGNDDGLDALLARPDIHAVIIALPISLQPSIVLKALVAGKHALSEKPIAKDVRDARALIDTYEKEYKPKGLVWRVAENFEMEPAVRKAGEAVRAGKIGAVRFFEVRIAFPLTKDNEYYNTEWRTKPDFQGGFVFDAGVHFAALLRTVLPTPPTHLSGFARLVSEHLAPTDTVHAVVQTADGVTGTFAFSLAPPDGAYGATNGIFVAGADGAISVCPRGGGAWRLTLKPKDGEEDTEEFTGKGVEEEVRAFVEVVGGGKDDGLQRPQGALADVAFIQAALVSNGQLVDLQSLTGECH